MPASELGWPVSRTPVFQVFGVKRKSNFDENNCSHTGPHESQEQLGNGAKRPCFHSDLEVNHNHIPPIQQQPFHEQQSQHHIQQQPHHDSHQQLQSNPVQHQHHQQVPGHLMQDVHASSPWQTHGHQESHVSHHVQNTHIMDINEETYSSPPDSTSTDAHMAMDDDCVPDPGQYSTPSSNDPQTPTPRGSGQGYHSQYCSSGDVSPTNSRVKCYCRPSWEGISGLKPCFVSDYY
ncbi:unnamed protein product [Owenia fusiformis]|uniref:Uncharacterized protein n=1 Tax=Owenia fusiformis TaxID=6347 RepID=A0A8J1UHI1_OWEFU|nr:unnamed protein product [Owenia fusiformis]